MMGQIIWARVATLDELKSIYSLEDAYLMYVAIYVPRQNEWLANERAAKKAEMRAKSTTHG